MTYDSVGTGTLITLAVLVALIFVAGPVMNYLAGEDEDHR